MNDTERRELNIWLHEALGNCAHEWRCDIVWKENGKYLYNSGQVNATCKKCGATTEDTFADLGDLQAPDYTGSAWPDLAEAMRQRGWMPIVKWAPDNIPNYGTPEPHQMVPRAICEMNWFGHHQRPPRPENALAIRDQLESADTPGEAVALASKSALEAEVS